MEKEVRFSLIRRIILKTIYWLVSLLIFISAMIILVFHKICPYFPVLFLFDFCFIVGHPLFLKHISKKKWYECTKDDFLALRYILLPSIFMELVVLLYYHNETILIIKAIMENSN